ncbi:MAG: hypothetical protein IIY06_01675 [Proteobacteria bacterium]|nr:hypothetical protein [Pseudomonadota bacterium]
MTNRQWFFLLTAGLMIAGCADNAQEASDCKPNSEYWNGEKCMPSDDDNCGAQGKVCTNGNICDVSSGQCVCYNASTGISSMCSFTCCDGVCSDLNSTDHCGRCDKTCEQGWACYMGSCTASCPGPDEEMCQDANGGSTCANLDYDRRHCGACGNACPGTDAARHIAAGQCSDGMCEIVCDKGYADLDDDPMNGCEHEASFECGNGIVEVGEACDGERLNDQTCASQVGFGSTGHLYCLPGCQGFDTDECTPATTCGNGIVDGKEVCDGSNIGNATCESIVGPGSTGHLLCALNCGGYDTSLCSASTKCGNGKVDDDEVCDGSDIGSATCESVVGVGSAGTVKCNDKCTGYDLSGCTAKAVCGNGIVEKGESCDGTNFNAQTCESIVGKGSSGALQCDSSCQIVASLCSAASQCGNNAIDGKEMCDGSQLKGMTCADVVGPGSTGTLSCLSNCSGFDVSQCTAQAKCGNNIVELNEVCDGTRLNDKTCASVVGEGSTGILRCNTKCDDFITTGCTASTTCGNGIVEAGEVCDGTDLQGATCSNKVGTGSQGTVLCGDNCKYFNLSGCSAASTCGNGTLDAGEVCEVGDLQGNTCASVVGNGSTGTLKCGSTCYTFDVSGCSPAENCGNSRIDDGEVCDGTNVAGRTCADVVGYGSMGILRCNATCTGFDTISCTAERTCGNGKLDVGEVCDGTLLNGATCSSRVGFGSTGELKCNAACSGYDTSSCTVLVTCGNGLLDAGEACDGALLNGKTCADVVGFGSVGTPSCNSACTGFTTGTCSAAVTCGNGILDDGETCDMNKLNGATCASVRGSGSTGTIRCNNTCDGYDLTNCSAPVSCGNGVIDEGEECDGSKFAVSSGCNAYNPKVWESGKLTCNDNCTVNTGACTAFCGNNVVNSQVGGVYIGEACDHSESLGDKFPKSKNSCEKVVGSGSTGTLTCSADCSTIVVNQCTAAAYCGDGMVNVASEACDGNAFATGSDDCASYSNVYKSGTKVKCLSNCQVDTSTCERKEYCGDGIVNGAEYCDGDSFMLDETRCSEWDGKYSSGSVKCNNTTCDLDYSACVLKPSAKCGNGVVEIANNEMCDGTQFMDGAGSCAEYAPTMYSGGSLSCTHDCQIDDSACTAIKLCGNGAIDPGEECDGSKFNGSFKACSGYNSMLYMSGGTLGCTSDCKIDVSGCIPYCGNGSVNTTKGEDCDHSASGDKFQPTKNTCAKVVGTGSTGTLACTNACKFDTSSCSPAVTEYCGDGIVNGTEKCDGTAFKNNLTKCTDWNDAAYSGGNVSCDASCNIVYSGCTTKVDPFCGDGIVNSEDEFCDGNDVADGLSFNCTDYSATYASGVMTCNASCEFDDSRCVTKVVSNCGNNVVDDDEYCDGSKFIDDDSACSDWLGEGATGTLKCTSNCQLDTSECKAAHCGDGVVNNDEDCDGTKFLLDITSCAEYSSAYTSGSLGCKANCTVDTSSCVTRCGNGVLDDVNEECDKTQFRTGFDTCNDWITGSTGTLTCKRTCEVDYSNCHAAPTAYCGDGIVNTNAEDCDGASFLLDVDTCDEYSSAYKSGKLSCNRDCTVNTSACIKKDVVTCGDGRYDDSEYCDAGQFMFGIRTCNEYSDIYTGGQLKCTSDCDIDTSACIAADLNTCGNGVLDSDEFCDGTLFLDDDKACSSWGDYASGFVSCTATCQLSFANCVEKQGATCGDGIVNNNEDCDKNAFLLDITSCSEWDSSYTSGMVQCTNDCKIDYTNCTGGSSNVCGDGVLGSNEYCDGNQFMFGITSCVEYDPSAYAGGMLKCSKCDIDTSECIVKTPACTEDFRCINGSLQMCDSDTGKWLEYADCAASGKICSLEALDCVNPPKPLNVSYCVFKYLDPISHIGYSRVLIPSGEEVMGAMYCTDDLNKPLKDWTEVNAEVNTYCSDCYSNTEFMSESYLGKPGVNYCTYMFTDGDNDFICERGYEGEHRPLLVNDSSIVDEKYTQSFTRIAQCVDETYRCNGNVLEGCENDVWVELEVCEGSTPICDVTSDSGCKSAAMSFDHTVTMNGWFTANKTDYKAAMSSEVFADGSQITVTGMFYINQNVIDGVTTIQRGNKNTSVVISGLSNGVGLVSFDYKSWGTNEDATTITVKAGSSTQTVSVAGGTGKSTFSYRFDKADASTVTITLDSASAARVLMDNFRWTSI